jgi:hypothetical protein
MSNQQVRGGYRAGPSGWVGWIAFAATMMLIVGVLGVIEGLAALLRDEDYFFVSGERALLTFNLTSWGWIHLILGLVVILTGVLLLKGSATGLILGTIVVGLHLIAQFAWIAAYPWWSAIVIALDILILWAIIVHGGELLQD